LSINHPIDMKHIRILFIILLATSASLMSPDASAQNKQQIQEAVDKYIMNCNLHVTEPVLLSMSDTLFQLAQKVNDTVATCMVPLFKMEYYRSIGQEDSMLHYLHIGKEYSVRLNCKSYYYQGLQCYIIHLLSYHRYDEARDVLIELNHEAIRDKNNYGLLTYYKNLIEIYANREKYRMAKTYCDTCIAIADRDSSLTGERFIVSFYRISMLRKLHWYDEALAAVKEGIEHPKVTPVFRGIYYAYECWIRSETGDLEGARKALDQVDQLLPNCYSRAAVSYAHIYYYKATKQYDKALQWIEEYEKNVCTGDPTFTYKEKSAVLFALGGHDAEAVRLAKAYYTHQDSIYNIEENYDDTNLLETFDANLNQLNELNTKNESMSWILYILCAVIIFIFVFLSLFHYSFFRGLRKGNYASSKTMVQAKQKLELDTFQSIQKSLLTSDHLDNDNYAIYAHMEQGSQNCNNFYHFFEYGKKAYIMMGETKGSPSKSIHVQTLIRDIARCEGRHTALATDIVRYLNQVIYNTYHGEVTATLMMGIVDFKTGVLSFCNCDHSYPIALNRSGDENVPYMIILTKPYRNPAIGASAETIFYGGDVPLKPGNKMLLYSNSLMETKDAEGNSFSDESLLTTLLTNPTVSSKEMVEICSQRALNFRNNQPFESDTTITCMEYKGSFNLSE